MLFTITDYYIIANNHIYFVFKIDFGNSKSDLNDVALHRNCEL